jgi:hypothetical protein
MLKIDGYYYKEEDSPKLVLSLDWFKFDDHWTQRYMFDRPMWDDEMMERARIRNLARCRWLRISLNLFHYKVHLDIKLKHIGNLLHGRIVDDGPHVPNFVKRNREKKQAAENKE